MPLMASDQTIDKRRFGRLPRLLEGIRAEIECESTELRLSEDRMEQCAAFSLEAMENGEDAKHLSAKIDALTRNLATDRGRHVSLEQQMSIVDSARAGLSRLLPSHRT